MRGSCHCRARCLGDGDSRTRSLLRTVRLPETRPSHARSESRTAWRSAYPRKGRTRPRRTACRHCPSRRSPRARQLRTQNRIQVLIGALRRRRGTRATTCIPTVKLLRFLLSQLLEQTDFFRVQMAIIGTTRSRRARRCRIGQRPTRRSFAPNKVVVVVLHHRFSPRSGFGLKTRESAPEAIGAVEVSLKLGRTEALVASGRGRGSDIDRSFLPNSCHFARRV
jgi:hypothetical protein